MGTAAKSAIIKLALVGLLAWQGAPASAEDNPPEPASDKGQIWLTSGFRSHHFDRSRGYNEQNTGLGFEYTLDKESAITVGRYNNSHRKPSTYLNLVYIPLELGPIRFGASAGVINGYPTHRNGKFTPMAIPVAVSTFKLLGHDAGINTMYVPEIKGRLNGAIAIQFKVRVQ